MGETVSIEDCADMAIRDQWLNKCRNGWNAIDNAMVKNSDVIARARLAATDDAQWSSKELKQVIRDLLRVMGL